MNRNVEMEMHIFKKKKYDMYNVIIVIYLLVIAIFCNVNRYISIYFFLDSLSLLS